MFAKERVEKVIEPFWVSLDSKSGVIHPYTNKVERRLSDMMGAFNDSVAVESMLNRGENPLIYEVYEVAVQPLVKGHLSFATTILHPGKIGDEYYMTKGHFHIQAETVELYIGLRGEGMILMQTRDGRSMHLSFKEGRMIYVPPEWAHRTVNTGRRELIFLTVHPSAAVHDYKTLEEKGFSKLIVEREGKTMLINNPLYKP